MAVLDQQLHGASRALLAVLDDGGQGERLHQRAGADARDVQPPRFAHEHRVTKRRGGEGEDVGLALPQPPRRGGDFAVAVAQQLE